MADTEAEPASRASHRGIRLLVVVLAVVVIVAIAIGNRSSSSSSDTTPAAAGGADVSVRPVKLEISGSSTSVDVTFTQPSGDISQASAQDVPSTWTGKYPPGSFVQISAQNDNDDGARTRCAIVVDGVEVDANSSTGSFTIADCSATIP